MFGHFVRVLSAYITVLRNIPMYLMYYYAISLFIVFAFFFIANLSID